MKIKTATAKWKGTLRQGQGFLNTESGALSDAPYSFEKRFGDEPGTNPEELIAAAHSGCFSMALASQLQKVHLVADSIEVQAGVTLEKIEDGFKITKVKLMVVAIIPGASQEAFNSALEQAKINCPVSNLLSAQITVESELLAQAEDRDMTAVGL